MNLERHDVGFAQRIDGRIGDLREALLAVIPKSARKSGEKCGRSVVAHAPVGFFAVDKSGEENFELVFGPAAGSSDAFGRIDGNNCGRRGSIEAAHARRNQLGLPAAEAFQNVAPAEKDAGVRLGDNHFAGAEAGAFGDARLFEIDRGRFPSRRRAGRRA